MTVQRRGAAVIGRGEVGAVPERGEVINRLSTAGHGDTERSEVWP